MTAQVFPSSADTYCMENIALPTVPARYLQYGPAPRPEYVAPSEGDLDNHALATLAIGQHALALHNCSLYGTVERRHVAR